VMGYGKPFSRLRRISHHPSPNTGMANRSPVAMDIPSPIT
jgi:hypothetical protein